MEFRKKPVVINAVKWTGQNLEEVMTFIQDGHKDFAHLPTTGGYIKPGVGHTPALGTLTIPTLEGDHTANLGDWIIKGVKGEFYPCKPDIFEMTYEAANDSDRHIIPDHLLDKYELLKDLPGIPAGTIFVEENDQQRCGLRYYPDLKDSDINMQYNGNALLLDNPEWFKKITIN